MGLNNTSQCLPLTTYCGLPLDTQKQHPGWTTKLINQKPKYNQNRGNDDIGGQFYVYCRVNNIFLVDLTRIHISTNTNCHVF